MKKLLLVLLCVFLTLSLCFCKKTGDDIPDDNVINENSNENTPVNDEREENKNGQDTPEITDVTYELTLYFPDNDALYLHPENRTVTIKSNESIEMRVMEELVKGPTTENRWAAVEGEDLINSITTDENGLCTIDLKSDFEILNSGGTTREAFVFGSIVNSLCSLEGIECVKFNIDGDTAYEYGGHSVLDAVFYPQYDLVAE